MHTSHAEPGPVAPRPQLLTYPDSLGGDLKALAGLLEGPLDGLFTGVHVLPPFPSSGDRGFAPLTYREIEPRFGSWDDIRRLGERHDVLLDLMINHISRRSAEFQDFERRGRRSPHADLFITLDKIWPHGHPPPADVQRIFLRRPSSPFSTVTIEATGEREQIWTTFGTAEVSEQVDLDVTSSATRALIRDWFQFFAAHRVRIVRLDAVGYVVKKPGTTCFMVEPDIYAFLAWVTDEAASFGLTLLPEVHDAYPTQQRLAAHGHWTYDFALPGLVLDAMDAGDARLLAGHMARMPERVFTTLDSHDGIPVRPDLDGILPPNRMLELAALVQARGGNASRILSAAHAGEVDVHQLNCTYFSALGEDEERYLAARAIQLFGRGVPQVYYIGLLAGANDPAGITHTGDGRAINRHDYTSSEIAASLERPVVRRLLELVRFRNTHPAFEGALTVEQAGPGSLVLAWRHGSARCSLTVDVSSGAFSIES